MNLKERDFFLLFCHCVDLYSRNFVVITICVCFWCVETTEEHVCMCTSIGYNIGSSKITRRKIPMQNTHSPFAWAFFIQLTYQIHVFAFCSCIALSCKIMFSQKLSSFASLLKFITSCQKGNPFLRSRGFSQSLYFFSFASSKPSIFKCRGVGHHMITSILIGFCLFKALIFTKIHNNSWTIIDNLENDTK